MKHIRESVIKLIRECRESGTRIDLSFQNLFGLDLRWANLQGADLQGANLQGANLQGANLQGADLRWANLQGADLQGANLRWANLQGANLQGANLQGADLRWANLQGADHDYTGFHLSCKSLNIKCDKRLVSQLLYHLCRLDVKDCPEWDELRNDERVIALANHSHVIPAHGLPVITKLVRELIEKQEEK